MNTEQSRLAFRREVVAVIFVSVLYATLYWLFRLPTRHLELAFYDDGETLYHVLATMKGLVPHAENYNHHFLGYVIPFCVLGWFTGFGVHLIAWTKFGTLLLTALGGYALVRRIASPLTASLTGAILLSAREPWVLGFFQQYQINFFFVWGLFCLFQGISSGKHYWFFINGVLFGLAVCFDQRALFLLSIYPLLLFTPKGLGTLIVSGKCFSLLFLGTVFPLALALIYLWGNSAVPQWWEQTFVFPLQYRGKSATVLGQLITGAAIYKHLILGSPFLFIAGCAGYFSLLLRRTVPPGLGVLRFLLTASFPALLLMPLLGGRDYHYYTITWFPWLALCSVSLLFWRPGSVSLRAASRLLVFSPLGLALCQVAQVHPPYPYGGDGVTEVVRYMSKVVPKDYSLYVWGYRLEIYARLQKTSFYPFASRLFIHPDKHDAQYRSARIFPKYEKEFLDSLEHSLPDFVITFSQEQISLSSPAQQALYKKLASDFQKIYSIKKRDFLGNWSKFMVYKKLAS